MTHKPRVALAGLSCECCTFSPLRSGEDDFILVSGDDLEQEYPFLAQHPDLHFVPLTRARALPGGSIEPRFYQQFKARLLDELSEGGPWDGVFLHLHGAAHVYGGQDLEGDLLAAIRGTVGPRCLLSASYDLHGNVSTRVIDNLDILTAYRTAPHVDWMLTLERACALLARCLQENLKPVMSFIPVPILLPGEMTSTEFEPAAGLYGAIPELIASHDLLDASLLIGYVWADEPRSTGAVVTVGLNQASTQAAAVDLAENFWSLRHQFQFGVPTGSVDQIIAQARLMTESPVVISDSGDNPTAGGAGDTPFVLGRLIHHQVASTLVAGLADAPAVQQCQEAGVSAELNLSLGGKLDPVNAQPLDVCAKVLSLHTVPWSLTPSSKRMNDMAVVQIEGIQVILTQRRTPFHHLKDLCALGLNPKAFRIIVVKMGYLVPELEELASSALLALSPGAVNQDFAQMNFTHIQRPMFPLDAEMNWQPSQRCSP